MLAACARDALMISCRQPSRPYDRRKLNGRRSQIQFELVGADQGHDVDGRVGSDALLEFAKCHLLPVAQSPQDALAQFAWDTMSIV